MPTPTATVPLQIGIVGFGRMGSFHLERLSLREDCQTVAAFDSQLEKADYARSFGCRIHERWNDFLDDDEIEVVLIATPPESHARLAIEALRVAKHVVVEKPLCLSVAEADSMINAARGAKRTLSVIHSRRWDENFAAAAQTLQSGQIGHLHAVKLVIWEFGISAHANSVQDGWRSDWRRGGGLLYEFGAHYFDQLLQLVKSPIESVYARVCGIADGLPDSERAFLAIINFTNGVQAHIEVNLSSPAPVNSGWLLTGTNGGFCNGRQYLLEDDGEIYSSPVELPQGGIDRYYESLVGHLRSEGDVPIPAEEGRRVIELIETARKSAATSKVVVVS